MKIKEITFKKYSRKAKDYVEYKPFEKYEIGEIKTSEKGWITIEVTGPKQKFLLCSTQKPLKVYRPGIAPRELPFFFVTASAQVSPSKIQGASHFALDDDVLIPYKTSGRGCVCELGR